MEKFKNKEMSFFQLTSLGPENFIQSTLINCGCKNKKYLSL